MRVAAELQDLVDDLADELGLPISVEDRRWRLLSHSAHTTELDAVRRDSILRRAAAPEVAAWLDSLGLGDGVTDVPANAQLGMLPRVCAPVRHGDALLGFLWVVGGPLGDAARARLAEVAAHAGDVLWRRRLEGDPARVALRDELRSALAGEPARLPPGPRVVLALSGDEDAAERLRRRWDDDLVWTATEDGVLALAWLRSGGLAELGRAIDAARAGPAGIAEPGDDVARGAAQARIARRLGPGRFDGLGGRGLVAELWEAAGRPDPPAAIAAVAGARHGDELLAALEAVLDAAGDVAAAATALGLHRATLYRRLGRVEELTGLDLDDGDARLLLHLGLRIHRLR